MAELLIAQGWTPPDSIALRLREDVPEDVFVVVGATVYGTEFDIIIVSNCGLIVLYLSETRVDASAAAESIGQAQEFFREAVQRSEHALDQFMQDEFPALHPAVRHLIVGVDVADQLADSGMKMVASVASEEQMVDAILTTFDPDCPQMLDQRQCSELAQAYCERRLTVRQRATVPFVFRTGDLFGRGKTVWTIQEAILHMDRHPDDGVFHLRNGTFVRWLQEQGAGQLAATANDALNSVASSPREMLETFLIDTGQVDRPSIKFRPKAVDLGPIQVGSVGLSHLEIRQDRGRGHLFGQVKSIEPWMSVTPSTFSGSSSIIAINVETGSLPISIDPYETFVNVASSAADGVLKVPVTFRVVGAVSVVQRLLLRPLAALILAGIIGFTIGWMIGLTQPFVSPEPGRELGLGLTIARPLGTAILVGIFWAVLGAVVGLQIPDTWPFSDATRICLSRTILWMLGLFVLGAGSCWVVGRLSGLAVLNGSYGRCVTVGLVGAALALLPVVLRGTDLTNDPVDPAKSGQSLINRRNLVTAGMLLLLFAIIFTGVRQRDRLASLKDVAQQEAMVELSGLDTQLQHWGEVLLVRYYDRRAPSRASSERAAGTDQITITLESGPIPPLSPLFISD